VALAGAWQPVPRQAYVLAAAYSFGNHKLQRAAGRLLASVGVDRRNAQLNRSAGAKVAVFQRNLNGGMLVLAVSVHGGTLPGAAASTHAAKERFEKLAVLALAETAAEVVKAVVATGVLTGSALALRPAWWWAKLLPGLLVQRGLIIGGALFGVFEHVISFGYRLKLGFGVFFLADIWVVLARQFAVRPLDVFRGGVLVHAHDLVVILELHRPLSRGNPAFRR